MQGRCDKPLVKRAELSICCLVGLHGRKGISQRMFGTTSMILFFVIECGRSIASASLEIRNLS